MDVGVAAETVPAAPLLKTTVLLPAVGSKPNPLMTTELALAGRLIVRVVTTNAMVATCTAEPLLTPFVVTIAVRLPAEVGLVVRATVNEKLVAAVTVPTAPLLNTTVLFEAIGSKPKPLKVIVEALEA